MWKASGIQDGVMKTESPSIPSHYQSDECLRIPDSGPDVESLGEHPTSKNIPMTDMDNPMVYLR